MAEMMLNKMCILLLVFHLTILNAEDLGVTETVTQIYYTTERSGVLIDGKFSIIMWIYRFSDLNLIHLLYFMELHVV